MPVNNGGSSPHFSQQGTVDWVSLSNATFTFSVEVMSRLSKAGVETITFAIGQTLFMKFTVPPDGQKRVTDAVSKLKACSSLGDVLWFGFGLKHVIRILCETEQGVICTGICACLCVSYDSDFRARVFQSMCGKVIGHEGLRPSLPQWAALINVCAGSLAHSMFPDRVEGFCRLAHAQYTAGFQRNGVFGPTTPEALADAILSLSKVSNGTQTSTTVSGGPDCGWLAAIAEWLFNLRVEVKTESGQTLYWQGTNYDGATPQVTIVFASDEPAPTITLQVVNRTFRLPFGKFNPFNSALHKRSLFIPGRSSWSTILGDTFGSTFRLLISPPLIAQSASLIFAALPRPKDQTRFHARDWEMLNPWMTPQTNFSEPRDLRMQNAERSFLDNAVARLPELAPLLEHRDTRPNTVRRDDDFDLTLKSLCDCCQCVDASKGRPKVRDSPDITVIHSSASKKQHLEAVSNIPDFKEGICLARVASSIFGLLWLLSWLDIDEGVQPTVTGLLWLYNQLPKLIDSEDLRNQTYSSRWRDSIRLFLGRSFEKKSCSAISYEGLCLYLPALEDVALTPSQQLRLRVTPGGIAWSDRTYQTIIAPKINKPMHEVERYAFMRSTFKSYRFRVTPAIQVSETLRSEDLEAWIDLTPEIISRQSVAYKSALFALGTEPTISGEDDLPPMNVTADIRFFLNRFEESIAIYDCHQTSLEVLPHAHDQKETKNIHAGICTEVESSLWASIEEASYLRPELNELVLFFWAEEPGSLVLHLVRGATTMLYFLFNRFASVVKESEKSKFPYYLYFPEGQEAANKGLSKFTPRLMYMGRCLLCFVRHSAVPAREGNEVIIHTIRSDGHTCLTLLRQWRDPMFGRPFAHQAKHFKRREDNKQYIPITDQESLGVQYTSFSEDQQK